MHMRLHRISRQHIYRNVQARQYLYDQQPVYRQIRANLLGSRHCCSTLRKSSLHLSLFLSHTPSIPARFGSFSTMKNEPYDPNLFEWTFLCSIADMRCQMTLCNGQAFCWRQLWENLPIWTGVIRCRLPSSDSPAASAKEENLVVSFKEEDQSVYYHIHYNSYIQPITHFKKENSIKCKNEDVPSGEELLATTKQTSSPKDYIHSVVLEYFHLTSTAPDLRDLYSVWSKSDDHFSSVSISLSAVRLLRQPPLECFLSFLTSSNNNISRITKLLLDLREFAGDRLCLVNGTPIHAFPTLPQLVHVTEQQYRDLGFGYRAKFFEDSIRLLKMLGGEEYLWSLRGKGRELVVPSLLQFKGVGRKVADCIALSSMDCYDCIPIDTHVWNIARTHFASAFTSKEKQSSSLSDALYLRIGDAFRERYGQYAGWSQLVLFTSMISAFRTNPRKRKHKTVSKVEPEPALAIESTITTKIELPAKIPQLVLPDDSKELPSKRVTRRSTRLGRNTHTSQS